MVLACAAGVVSVAQADPGPVVRVRHIDGTTFDAVWNGSPDGVTLGFTRDGRRVRIALDELDRVTFGTGDVRPVAWPINADATGPAPPFTVFYLADGGVLTGELIDPPQAADALFAHTTLGAATSLAFDRLAAVQLADPALFPRADEVLRAALVNRQVGQDIFITRESEDVKAVHGRLESLGAARGSFAFGEKSRGFSTEKAYAVVFATGPMAGEPRRFPLTVTLSNGSTFSGSLARSSETELTVDTSLGMPAAVRLADIARLDIHSDRVVYLSDLTPTKTLSEGILHRPWTARMDRSVSGGPLSIAGRVFKKGVGVHSRTALTYDLGGRFEKFVSTVGLDDAVRPRGSVVFRVSADGVVVFDSGTITGTDAAKHIIVEIAGAKTLTLLVDYGDAVDLADQADWGGARLLKPAAVKP